MLEVDVAGAREEGDAVAVAQREVAVAAGEICLGGESVREGHTPDVAMQTLKAICSAFWHRLLFCGTLFAIAPSIGTK